MMPFGKNIIVTRAQQMILNKVNSLSKSEIKLYDLLIAL